MKRKDSNGRTLRTGERYDSKNNRYVFQKMIDGERTSITSPTLDGLREKIKVQTRERENHINDELRLVKKIYDQSELVGFIDFFKEELPDVYSKLYREFKKRKEIME